MNKNMVGVEEQMRAPENSALQGANLEVTQKCDSRCVSCNIWRMSETLLADNGSQIHEEELSFEEHIRVLSELRALGCRAVQLHGGEPLLNPRLADLVAHGSSLGMFTGIATNGLSMTQDRAKALVDAGLGSIKFSLDGPKEMHNRLRGRKDAYVKQMRAMELVQELDVDQKVYKSIRSNVSSANLERIDEVMDIARDMSIGDVQFAFYSVIDETIVRETNEVFGEPVASLRSLIPKELLPKDTGLIEKKRGQIIEKANRYGITLGDTGFFSLPADQIPKGIKRKRTRCSIFDYSLTIDAFGEVVPCEYVRFSLGNTRNEGVKDILEGSRLRDFRRIYSENYHKLRICDYCCYSL
jgi:radical SAM protein with 4Fe4S-binding SPASM domain